MLRPSAKKVIYLRKTFEKVFLKILSKLLDAPRDFTREASFLTKSIFRDYENYNENYLIGPILPMGQNLYVTFAITSLAGKGPNIWLS